MASRSSTPSRDRPALHPSGGLSAPRDPVALKILITGDLHLGRRSTRLPAEWADDRRFSAASAWEALIDRALARSVDVVVLTGDVVDRENRFYEARGPLEAGLRRLAQAGIDTVAVAGNHDFDVLPRLASLLGLERFHLLGTGGVWQRLRLERRGEVVTFDGWSFPRERVSSDPLELYDLPTATEGPTLGVVHGDLGATTSTYAPLSRGRLAAQPVHAWLLGHLHTPQSLEGPGPLLLYPGSPQALDPGETGAHGAWLLTLEGKHLAGLELLPLSSVRYEPIRVDLEGAADRESFDRRWSAALQKTLSTASDQGGERFELLMARLEMTGRTRLAGRLQPWLADLRQQTEWSRGAIRARIEAVRDHTLPPIDLAQLAGGRDALGALAGLLLSLEPGQATPPLVGRAVEALQSVHFARGYAALAGDAAPDEPACREALRLAGVRLLEVLLAQREALGSKPTGRAEESLET